MKHAATHLIMGGQIGDAIHDFGHPKAAPTRSTARRRCYSWRMKTPLALLLVLCATPLSAETLLVGDQVQIKPAGIELPQRGSSMATVEGKFGAPK
jgi:hypothetical protein